MVLAIVQQTNMSLLAQQVQVLAMQLEYLNAHDTSASQAQLTQLYEAFLSEALAAYSNISVLVQSDILHLSSTSSLLPVRLLA